MLRSGVIGGPVGLVAALIGDQLMGQNKDGTTSNDRLSATKLSWTGCDETMNG
jgi:hypothetical protein